MSRPADDPAAWLGRRVRVLIDRPLGSTHPDGAPIYPVNYGYLPGTESGDGEGVDAYVLGTAEPISEITGRVVAIVHRRDDVEDKLVVAADGLPRSASQIAATVAFQERYFDTTIIV